MRVVTIPCLSDNYAYLVICEATGEAAVVDPSEAAPVFDAIAREKVRVTAIWNTHHHPDHTGGNQALAADLDGVAVVAHTSDFGRVPAQTVRCLEGDTVALGSTIRARVIHNPGHTSGAISYWIPTTPEAAGSVFTGDTLFCAGCGRLFEGTPAEMHASLSKLAALPPETRVYCGHEYTAANLRFAAAAEPDNRAIQERAARVAALGGAPSVPSTIGEERDTNPFLRASVRAVAASASAAEPDVAAAGGDITTFAALRRWKDRFR
jgi:hydroxyacylglutathione hydrolase